ncbi:hypothetical protein H5410_046059 [Solanum commersonii]|uniref:Uncharacterized protein n=1 Tax=Solanum commersonii TaxID=4109 RepID=A0A9J5XB90_SOLCO|nr:hypothetical protein H5410_046059 [Solanum commersonii]
MKTTTHFGLVQGPQKIKKTITHYEQFAQIIVLPFAFTFSHNGNKHRFELWDVTEERNPKNDVGTYVVKMKPCKDYAIVCAD